MAAQKIMAPELVNPPRDHCRNTGSTSIIPISRFRNATKRRVLAKTAIAVKLTS